MKKGNYQKKFKGKKSQRFVDVPILEKRIKEETPPSHIYYYK